MIFGYCSLGTEVPHSSAKITILLEETMFLAKNIL
jgi:hypothetical protein